MNVENEIATLYACIIKQTETMNVLIATNDVLAKRIAALEFASLPITTGPQ